MRLAVTSCIERAGGPQSRLGFVQKLFVFLEHQGVEPTNNGAERALRTGLQWRKICFGNRSRFTVKPNSVRLTQPSQKLSGIDDFGVLVRSRKVRGIFR